MYLMGNILMNEPIGFYGKNNLLDVALDALICSLIFQPMISHSATRLLRNAP